MDLAADLVCDHKNDKGIDGIYVDEETEEVYLFQVKYRETFKRADGDKALRHFVGSAQWFTKRNIKRLDSSNASQDLKRLIVDYNIFPLIDQGYSIKLIFVTTGHFNKSSRGYIKVAPPGEYWDCNRLHENYTYSGIGDFVENVCRFKLDSDANVLE
ncbi:unnamed protein product, partial [marine sediment metagenome]